MLTLLATLMTLVLSTLRLHWGVWSLLFFLPFFPRVLAFAAGPGGLALTQRRAGLFVLLFVLVLSLIIEKSLFSRLVFFVKRQSVFFVILVALLGLKAVSTLLHSGPFALSYVADEVFFSLILVALLYLCLYSLADERKFILLFVIGLLASGVLSSIEQMKEVPLLQGVVNVSVATEKDNILEGRERGTHYRSQALFDNPLLLAEFVCLALPFALFYLQTSPPRNRLWIWASILFVPIILWQVYSRSGLIVALVALSVYSLAELWKRSDTGTRRVMHFFLIAMAIFIIYMAVTIINDPTLYFSQDGNSENSAIERASQYIIVGNAVADSPLLGYGLSQNISADLEFLNHLDNYWLRLLLEVGITGFILFSALMILMIKKSITGLRECDMDERFYFAAMLSFFSAFMVYKLFLSMPVNNIYFFMVCALFFWHTEFSSVKKKEQDECAH